MKLTKKTSIRSLPILILLFSTIACSSPKIKGIDPEFKDYVQDFGVMLPEYKKDVENINIGFEDFYITKDDFNVIGRCYYNPLSPNTVSVDRMYWAFATPISRYFTILHELGHCVCYAPHSEATSGWIGTIEDFLFRLGVWKKRGYLEDGCPASLMHPTEFSQICAIRHFNHYIEDFKKVCRKRD